MARWTFVAADPDGTQRSDWIGATGRKLTWSLDAPATCAWSSRGEDPGATEAHETASDLLAYRDGVLMFRGRIGSTSDDITPDTHTTSWSAVDYRGLLERRLMPAAWSATNQEQVGIGWSLIAIVQIFVAGGAMGITDGSTVTGVKRDRAYDRGTPIGAALTQLGNVVNGFDWEIGPDLVYRTWYPTRGTAKSWVADYGGTVTAVKRTLDTSNYATDIIALGSEDPGTSKPLYAARSIVGPRGPGGRWDAIGTWSDVSVQATLDEYADRMIADTSIMRPSYEVTLRPGTWSPDDAWLGDTTQIVIKSGRLDVNESSGRIHQISIDIGENGDETVTLTYGRAPADLRDRLLSTAKQVATLSRR